MSQIANCCEEWGGAASMPGCSGSQQGRGVDVTNGSTPKSTHTMHYWRHTFQFQAGTAMHESTNSLTVAFLLKVVNYQAHAMSKQLLQTKAKYE